MLQLDINLGRGVPRWIFGFDKNKQPLSDGAVFQLVG